MDEFGDEPAAAGDIEAEPGAEGTTPEKDGWEDAEEQEDDSFEKLNDDDDEDDEEEEDEGGEGYF